MCAKNSEPFPVAETAGMGHNIWAYSLVVRRHIRIVEAAVQFRLGPQIVLNYDLFDYYDWL